MAKDNKTYEEYLQPDNILIAEFNYIAQTAFQASEDRVKVTNFFLASIGSLIIAFMNWDWLNTKTSSVLIIIGIFFMLLTILGILTLLQLARLRIAWFGSIKAMNHIKDFYSENFEGEKLDQAFLWNNKTKPKMFKQTSVGFILAFQVAILSSVSLAAGFVFLGCGWGFSALTGLCSIILLINLYKNILEPEQEEEKGKSAKK